MDAEKTNYEKLRNKKQKKYIKKLKAVASVREFPDFILLSPTF